MTTTNTSNEINGSAHEIDYLTNEIRRAEEQAAAASPLTQAAAHAVLAAIRTIGKQSFEAALK